VLAWSFGSALLFATVAFVVGMLDAPSNPPAGWESLPFWDRVEIHGANYEAIWWGAIGLLLGTAVAGGWRVLGSVVLGALGGGTIGFFAGLLAAVVVSLGQPKEGWAALIPFLWGFGGLLFGAVLGFLVGIGRISRESSTPLPPPPPPRAED